MHCFWKIGLLALVLGLACAGPIKGRRTMTSKEIVDALMGIPRSDSADTNFEEIEALRAELAKYKPPPGVRARLVIYPEKRENNLIVTGDGGKRSPTTAEQFPFLTRLLEVMGAMKTSTRQGTKNVIRTAFPALFVQDR